MRKLQTIVVKGQEIFVGLEDSKRTWKVSVRSGGTEIHNASMPAQFDILMSYFRNRFPECVIHVMYEAGFRGFGLFDKLTDAGIHCVVTPPHTVTEAKCNRTKNDRVDCRRLSKNLESGDYGECYPHDKELREDRQINRTYGQFMSDVKRVKNRIRRCLEWHGLDHHFTAGRWGNPEYEQAWALLKKLELSESLRFSFELLFIQLQQLQKHCQALRAQFQQLCRKPRYQSNYKILCSSPGIGSLTAIRLLLEWGDMSRFKHKAKFSSFLGLTPSEHSSGERERKGHITRQGSRLVRSMLVESAWVAIKKDPVLLDKFRRVSTSSGSKKKAIVAVARKLGLRLRTLLISGTNYQLGIIE